MPNWVYNYLNVEGAAVDIEAFRAKCFTRDEAGKLDFDFNAFIPLPDCINNTTSGSDSDLGLAALIGLRLKEYLTYPWIKELGIKTQKDLLDYCLKNRPEALVEAEKCLKAHQETGYYDWYAWSVANWGTKWNACSTYIDDLEDGLLSFGFNTPWSYPLPVLEAMGHQWLQLKFFGSIHEESDDYRLEFEIVNGKL